MTLVFSFFGTYTKPLVDPVIIRDHMYRKGTGIISLSQMQTYEYARAALF